MIKGLLALLTRYKGFILYAVFGVLTTLVNVVSYYVCARICGMSTMPATFSAWVLAVLFAYVTNRTWVFGSDETTTAGIALEMVRFFGCRITTGIVDWLCMFLFVTVLSWNDVLIKTAANVLVIILNYIASKLIIFRKN